jgi:PKD repeat protein
MRIFKHALLTLGVVLGSWSHGQAQCAVNIGACVPGTSLSDIPFCVSPTQAPPLIVGKNQTIDVNWAIGRTITYPPGEPTTVAISRVEIVEISNVPSGVSIAIRSGNPADPAFVDPITPQTVQTGTSAQRSFTLDNSIPVQSQAGIFGCTRFTGTPDCTTPTVQAVIVKANFYVRQIDENGVAYGPEIDPDNPFGEGPVLGFIINPREFTFGYRVDPFVVNISDNTLQTVCGSGIQLAANSNTIGDQATDNVTYSWAPTAGVSNPSSLTPIFTPSATTVYTLTSSFGCQSETQTVEVKVVPVSTPTITNPPLNSCTPASFTVSANSNNGEIFWYTQETGGVPVGQGPSYKTPIISANTIYWAEASNGQCNTGRVAVEIRINPKPQSGFSFTPSVGRTGQAVTFTNTSTGADSYSWNFGFPGANSSQANPSFIYVNPGLYTIRMIAINAQGCTDTTISQIEVLFGTDRTDGFDVQALATVYPNPTTDLAHLAWKAPLQAGARAELYTTTGQRVLTQALTGLNHETLDLSTIAAGLYTLKLSANGGVYTTLLRKQ